MFSSFGLTYSVCLSHFSLQFLCVIYFSAVSSINSKFAKTFTHDFIKNLPKCMLPRYISKGGFITIWMYTLTVQTEGCCTFMDKE